MEARYECPLYHGGYDLIGDGNIGLNPGWADAPWSSDFVDIRGGNAPVPRFRTRMKMMWEERGLYVGAEIQDPELYATQTERNSFLWQYDNDFEVFLSPASTRENYYEFEINALNTIFELTLTEPYRDGGKATHGTNLSHLRSAVHVEGTLNSTATAWSVAIFFPFQDLLHLLHLPSFWPKHSTTWRMNASRVQWHTIRTPNGRITRDTSLQNWGDEDNWVWSPQGEVDMHIPDRWGIIAFTDSRSA